MTETAELIFQLFVHRKDVFAVQQPSGAYLPAKSPIMPADVDRHLQGAISLGTYVLDTDDTVRCVVFDLDTYDKEALRFLCNEVEQLVRDTDGPQPAEGAVSSLRCLILEDSGGKGYHIWLPLSENRPARDVRAWTERIREQYQANAYAEDPAKRWPPLEIFPKQDTLGAGGYGNLVKLPLGVHAKSHARSRFVPRPGWASHLRELVPFTASLIPSAPEPTKPERRTADDGTDGPTRLPCVNRILNEGAGSGQRDNALYLFARYARGCGVPRDLVQTWCEEVNEGFSPPMTAREVSTKVASAFRADAPHPSCGEDWLREFCPGGDDCYSSGPRARTERTDAHDSYPAAMLPREERLRRRRMEGD